MSSDPTGGGKAPALAWAREAHALVQAHPRQALALAERALAAASSDGDVEAEVAARYALGWAQGVLGDGRTGRATLRAGIRVAERHRDRHGAGLLRRHLAVWLAIDGQTRAAEREIAAAMVLLSGRERARSQVQRVEIHRTAHAADPDLHRRVCADAGRALRLLRREGDQIWEARLLFNRGLLHLDRGELDRAESDLRRAHALYTGVGAEAAAVNAVVVIAELALLRGEVLTCLRAIDEIQPTLTTGAPRHDYMLQNLEECRVMALTQARLLPEARAEAEAYVLQCARTGRGDYIATAMLDLASIALTSGDPGASRLFANKAARSFAARGKPAHAALARATSLRTQLLEGSLGRSSVRAGLEAAAVLERAGWRRDAARMRLLLVRVALATGSRVTARRQFELARPLRRGGTVTDRIELCHVRALLRLSEGDRAGAERLLADGLKLLEDYRAALGAIELRATASGIGVELSQQGLRIALESREPAKILSWAERLRGNALRVPLVRAPADRELGVLQAELRRVVNQIRNAEEKGGTVAGGAAKQARIESAIRARTRLVQGEGESRATVTRLPEAAKVLGERSFVEYIELDGALGALTVANGRLESHELGPDGSAAELEWLRFALGRLARGRTGSAMRAAASSNARAAAAALDRLLVAPLLPALGDAPLVLVPTGALHALPWGALPSLRGRPLVVAPSLSVWLDLARLPHSRRRKTTVIAGPRLRHSAAEVRNVASLLTSPIVLNGKAATAKATLAALDGAALAHLACHGHFRAESPLFSALELADGPVNVYELQSLRRPPEMVVLSACDLAVSRLHPGDELLGLSAALLGMGTRTIIASAVPIPDAAAKRLMLRFYRNIVAGDTPASALARAQAGAAVAGFVCLGSG